MTKKKYEPVSVDDGGVNGGESASDVKDAQAVSESQEEAAEASLQQTAEASLQQTAEASLQQTAPILAGAKDALAGMLSPPPAAPKDTTPARDDEDTQPSSGEHTQPSSGEHAMVPVVADEVQLPSGRRVLPRALSVFRRNEPQFANREEYNNLHDDDEIPARSPLSSVPFFMWGGLALFATLIASLLLSDLAKPLFMLKDDALRQNMLTFLNVYSRAAGMLLAAVVTLCAIAIPLTANNYTSKLLGLFTDSKVNRSMFALLIATNIIDMMGLLFFTAEGSWPVIIVSVVATLTFLCFVMIIPYAFYLFHFLQPDEIIRHIEREVMDDLMAVKLEGNGASLELHRKRIIQNLKNLSNIALRSVDRHDRDTAMLSLEALRHIIHHYFAFKHEMPSQWFRVSRMYFLSLSGEMRRRVEQGKTFLEAEVMEEFSLVLGATFGRLRDMVRMIARTIRHIGVEANEVGLPAVLELTSLYFNTFLRAAISRREPEAIYMIVYHYRRMAEEMMATNHERPVRAAYYLSYYGNQAVRSGMIYVANLISFDLANMTALAYELNAASKAEIFELFLAFDQDERVRPLTGVIKSRFKLAVYLHQLGFEEEEQRLCESLARCSIAEIEAGIQEIGTVKTPMFWEVTDRHRHNDYLSPALFRSHAHIKARLFQMKADGL